MLSPYTSLPSVMIKEFSMYYFQTRSSCLLSFIASFTFYQTLCSQGCSVKSVVIAKTVKAKQLQISHRFFSLQLLQIKIHLLIFGWVFEERLILQQGEISAERIFVQLGYPVQCIHPSIHPSIQYIMCSAVQGISFQCKVLHCCSMQWRQERTMQESS